MSNTIKIIEKAYRLNTNDYREPWYIDNVFFGETASKAKSKATEYLYREGYEREDGDEVSFINTRVTRDKENDRVEYKGSVLSRKDYERKRSIDERDSDYEKLIEKNPNAYAHIIKRGSYYCDDYNGYTEHYVFGGIYPIKNAYLHVKGCDDYGLHMVVIENNEAHNKRINDIIEKLKGHLIPTE